MNEGSQASFYEENPAALLQKLIQFDTSNPPGNERACMLFVQDLLRSAGIDSQLLAKDSERPNLVARLPGQGKSQPLLLYGHLDVVTAANQAWTHPPFAGEMADGFIWGRGALDMKGGVAMFLSALLRQKQQGQPPPGDLILALVSDEEAGGDCGARYLVENHADQFAGIRYGLGEFGGFNLNIGKKRFYPIQVAEKQACWLRGTVRGQGGHGSIPVRRGAMYKLGRLLQAWSQKRLPVHITPPVRQMVSAMTAHLGGLTGFILGQLLTPALTDRVLDILGSRGAIFDPLLHNTISPTMVRASEKTNVIPSEVTFHLDGRLLPGFGPNDLIRELNQLCPEEVEWEVVLYDGGKEVVDLGLFEVLAAVLREADPEGIPVPLVLSGMTDGRFFARLGIQSYGFLPMQLPPNFAFSTVIHAADERIPVSAMEFGTNAIYQVIQRF
jgi:acetylornithine deacetylase/succinyl-diaminopimelate desuccinylase-like protein